MQHIHDFVSFINEARISIKRKYTEAHPAVEVSDHAPVREKVLGWVSEKGTVTKTELSQFLKGINEETGRGSASKWLSRNTRFFNVKEANGEKVFALSAMGKKVHEAILRSREKRVNESAEIDRYTKEFFRVVNALKEKGAEWKKAEGDEKAKLFQQLKDLTAQKKDIERKLDAAVAGKDRDLELILSEE